MYILNPNFSPFIIFHERETKMKSFIANVTFIVIFVFSGNVFSEENKRAETRGSSKVAKDNSLEKQENEKVQKVKYVIDFSNYSGGSVRKWLESKGLYYEGAAKYHPEIEFSIKDGMLFIKTKQPVRGFIVCKDIIIPDLPYFLSLFLGEADEINIPYKGRYFHAGGRYVCVGNPELKETVITELNHPL